MPKKNQTEAETDKNAELNRHLSLVEQHMSLCVESLRRAINVAGYDNPDQIIPDVFIHLYEAIGKPGKMPALVTNYVKRMLVESQIDDMESSLSDLKNKLHKMGGETC